MTLAVSMVITGSLNTIVAKWVTTEKARDSIGITETFDHPFLSATGLFFGEFVCLFCYYAYRFVLWVYYKLTTDEPVKIVERRREISEIIIIDNNVEMDDNDDDDYENNERSGGSTPLRPVNVKRNRIDTTIEDLDDIDLDRRSSTGSLTGSYDSGAISSDSEAAVVSSSGEEDQELEKGNLEFTWKDAWLFLFPAVCDVTATSAMYVGLYLTSASSYQMLRGSVIIFTGLASRIFLRKKLHWYKWLGMFVILGGLFIVGCADFFNVNCESTSTSGSGNDTLGDMEVPVGRNGVCNEKTERFHSIIGDIILITAQIVVAFQGTYEEKILKKYDVAPLQAIGWEGFFGFTILSSLLVAMKHIKTGSKVWGHSPLPPFYLEDAYDGLVQLLNNHDLLGAFIGVIVSICIFNVTGITVTQEMSATTRMVLDSVRTIFIWMISLGLKWQSFHFLQPLGFLCIIVGMCFYYNLLIVPYGRKIWQLLCNEENRKKKIKPSPAASIQGSIAQCEKKVAPELTVETKKTTKEPC